MNDEEEIISEGKAKDMILEFALKSIGEPIVSNLIQRELFPDSSNEEIDFLFKRIDNSIDKIADIRIRPQGNIIITNKITELFVKNGGYEKLERETKKEKETLIYKESIEFEKAKIDLELAKKMLEEYPKTKWFARIAFVIAITLAAIELYKFVTEIISNKF